MFTPPRGQNWSIIEAISKWWSDWTRRRSALAELECYAENEVERTAKELGISSAEIRKMVSRGPRAAELLLRRMVDLDLDRNEVSRTEPRVFQDLQRVCTLCESRRRCARDIARDSADPVWQDYCPNATTLMALNALPWMSRREW
jgi:hypothetical protein